ncbi:MAG: PepSY-associated TM helix domain-containing protein [Sphingobium sp.]
MDDTFRKSMAWVHTWIGLFLGWFAFLIFFTGSLSVFHDELNYWARPSLHGKAPVSRLEALQAGEAFLQEHAPDSRMWRIAYPNERYPALVVSWEDAKGATKDAIIDPRSGTVDRLETEGGSFFVRMHFRLHMNRSTLPVGIWIVVAASMAMLLACISGVVIHSRILKDLFLFRPRAGKQRRWLDAHNLLGVLPLPFYLLITFTGLVAYYYVYLPAPIHALYKGGEEEFRSDVVSLQYREYKPDNPPGRPAQNYPLAKLIECTEAVFGPDSTNYFFVRDPGRDNATVEVWRRRNDGIKQQVYRIAYDGVTGKTLRVFTKRSPILETQSFLSGLHFAEFGGSALRWLYVIAGMMGAAVIATGTELFIIKRKNKAASDRSRAAYEMIERVNVAMVAGLAVASAAFMCGMRLLPASLADRKWWEVFVFLAVWLASFVHAVIRPLPRLWREQLAAGALAAALVPVTAFVTPQLALYRTVVTGDWVTAAVDAVFLLWAGLLAVLAVKVKWQPVRGAAARKGEIG